MKTVLKTLGLLGRLSISATALLLTQQAMAAGTDAGVTVSNTALVDYQVGGAPQPQESSGPVTFLVDRKVDFDVSRVGIALTPSNLGASGILEFVVTNTSNDQLDFNLGHAQLAVGDGEIYSGDPATIDNDGRDTGAVTYAVGTPESAPGAGDAGIPDCAATTTKIDDLAADIAIRVYLCTTAPAVAINDDVAGLRLTATATDDAGVTLLAAGGVDDPNAVENVFATTSGTATEADVDGFVITAAKLTVTKASSVDGGGKAVPGATVTYTITIDNPATAPDATGISIIDDIDTNVSLLEQVAGVSTVTITDDVGGSTTCGAEVSGTDDNLDGCVFGTPAGRLTVSGASAFDVPSDQTWTVSFQVVIQ